MKIWIRLMKICIFNTYISAMRWIRIEFFFLPFFSSLDFDWIKKNNNLSIRLVSNGFDMSNMSGDIQYQVNHCWTIQWTCQRTLWLSELISFFFFSYFCIFFFFDVSFWTLAQKKRNESIDHRTMFFSDRSRTFFSLINDVLHSSCHSNDFWIVQTSLVINTNLRIDMMRAFSLSLSPHSLYSMFLSSSEFNQMYLKSQARRIRFFFSFSFPNRKNKINVDNVLRKRKTETTLFQIDSNFIYFTFLQWW